MTHISKLLLATLAFAAPLASAANGPWIEFSELEHGGGCTQLVQAAQNADSIAAWDQERLDELYACSKAGPIPDGFLNGKVILAPGGAFDNFVDYATKLGFPVNATLFKAFAQTLWKGKHFYRKDHALLNMMGSNVSPIFGHEIQGQMRFPAKVFCGQSLLDARRESIVIDYAFTDRVKIDGQSPYDDNVDWIAGGRTQTGKRGLNIRDEIRMVRPGFYLGRAYMDRVFLLNFTLTAQTPVSGQDVCWPGYTSIN